MRAGGELSRVDCAQCCWLCQGGSRVAHTLSMSLSSPALATDDAACRLLLPRGSRQRSLR